MLEITSLAEPFHRSHYYSFNGKIWELPSGQNPHIYVKQTYQLPKRPGSFEMIDVNVYAIIGSIYNVNNEPIMGIYAFIDLPDTGIEYVYRLECEYDDGGEVEEYLVGTFNGLVEELHTFWFNPPIEEVDNVIKKWGLDIVGYEV